MLTGPTGATRVAGVIGDPIRHSLSPALHNAAFSALGLDWVYVAFRVARGCGAEAVEAMRALDIAGLSVTMPHKAEVVPALDRLGPEAARLGVVNTISWGASTSGGQLQGDSTDGKGFIDALQGDDGFDPAGRRCLVLGTGGAARAVTLALGDAQAAAVTVAGRRPDQSDECAALAGPAGRGISGAAGQSEEIRGALAEADLIVNATPVGMASGDGLPMGLRAEWLQPNHFVVDLIYSPATTPLLAAARARGASAVNGLGMLIHQAAEQVELWTGRPAPLGAMSAAALAALTHPSPPSGLESHGQQR